MLCSAWDGAGCVGFVEGFWLGIRVVGGRRRGGWRCGQPCSQPAIHSSLTPLFEMPCPWQPLPEERHQRRPRAAREYQDQRRQGVCGCLHGLAWSSRLHAVWMGGASLGVLRKNIRVSAGNGCVHACMGWHSHYASMWLHPCGARRRVPWMFFKSTAGLLTPSPLWLLSMLLQGLIQAIEVPLYTR